MIIPPRFVLLIMQAIGHPSMLQALHNTLILHKYALYRSIQRDVHQKNKPLMKYYNLEFTQQDISGL